MLARWELIVCWAAFFYPYIFRAPHWQKRPSVVKAGPSRVGMLLEAAAFLVTFSFPLDAAPTSIRLVPAMLLAPVGAALAWTSLRHLGRQFRMNAGLWEDHELVRTGPYALVRHPIYAALGAMLLASLLIHTRSPWWLVALALYLAGTEIRVRTEDRLLASRFGEMATEYQHAVRAYVPFVR